MRPSGAARNRMNMNLRRSMVSALKVATAASLLLVATACYTFGGGGGFPSKLKTVAVIPFDNLTATPEIQREFTEALRKAMHDRLNLRDATEDKADVVVRGVIGKYEPDVAVGVAADPRLANVARRNLQLVIDIEITDQQTGKPLFTQKGLQSEGQYAEGQEVTGRKIAIETMMNSIIQKAQSQW